MKINLLCAKYDLTDLNSLCWGAELRFLKISRFAWTTASLSKQRDPDEPSSLLLYIGIFARVNTFSKIQENLEID